MIFQYFNLPDIIKKNVQKMAEKPKYNTEEEKESKFNFV